ncbi:MAG: glycosyltransferase family 39 protein [Betaproteobacteria bacterium]|nr:glycosyltransferase family 39 protein [Betaproteobacteria bacterium]
MSNPRPEPSLLALLAGWAAFSVAALWLRPLWPVDETRYASVAWEMWLRGDFLVPYVNGEPYSHKPPLLFWLIHLGWGVFGVNDWWPRLIGPLCALASIALLSKLEKILWEKSRNSPSDALWVLFGTLLFAGFITLTMFDLLLMLCVMAAMIGVVTLARAQRGAGLLWLGAGIGLGVLAKGPVVLLHVLPAALAAPWWAPELRGRLGRWYLDLTLGVLLGAAIALAWALPAAWSGGEAYRRAIFWGQTAGRVAESFAHRAPWWYYLPLLPLILFPWFVWPRFWLGIRNLRAEKQDNSVRFLLAWLLLTLVVFSLVSGKQAKYLLPAVPAFALLAGCALAGTGAAARRWDLALPALGFLALPAALAWIRAEPAALGLPQWAAAMPLWPIVVLALAAPALMLFCKKEVSAQVRALGFATLFSFAVLGAGVIPAFAPYADPLPAAQFLAAQQRLGVPLAHLGKYHAQYNFAGRLRAPIAILEPRELRAWVSAHPAGQVIAIERARHESAGAAGGAAPEFQGSFRGAWVQVWRGEALLVARPELR